MTCIAPSHLKTKAALREACATPEGRARTWIVDPSIVAPRYFALSEMRDGESITITNHPRRSWFASVERKHQNWIVK